MFIAAPASAKSARSRGALARGADDARAVGRVGRALSERLRLLRLVHRLEVELREHDRRKAGARADVGDDRAQVRIDRVRADDAERLLQLLVADVLDLEDAALLRLDEKERLVVELGRHRRRQRHFAHRLGDRLGADAEVDLDLRLALLEEDLRRVRLLERKVLEIDALNVERRKRAGVGGHGSLGVDARRRGERLGAGWRRSAARLSRAGEKRLEAAAAVERDQLVAAADVDVADEDLGHRPAVRHANHVLALVGLEVDADLIDLLDAALLQKRLGAQAIRARRGAVHLDGQHQAVFSVGRFAARQAAKPPASAVEFSKPSFFSTATARGARAPVGQTTTTGTALFFGSSRDVSRLASGTLFAPTAWPAAYSA